MPNLQFQKHSKPGNGGEAGNYDKVLKPKSNAEDMHKRDGLQI